MLVVYTTMIVATIGLGAILALRGQASMAKSTSDMLEARQYALAAIEAGRAKITADPRWRTNNANGTWINNQPVGDPTRTPSCAGTYSLTVVNPNGPLNRSDMDPVIMTATGYKGQAVQKVQVTLVANKVPLTCLNTSLTAGSNFSVNGTITAFNQVLATNGNATATGANITAFTEYVGSISGGNWLQTTTQVTKPRTLPDVTAFDFYIANGTPINYSDVLLGLLKGCVLSPQNNPFGSQVKNPSGIYVIDCLGNSISCKDFRAVGTVVLLNVGSGSDIKNSVNMISAVANYPCLMVQGNLDIAIGATALSEATQIVNFNPGGISPPGTASPYPWGSVNYDNDQSDSYPSVVNGLIYVSGNITGNPSPQLSMLVAGGTISLTAPKVAFNSTYYSNPPPGFYTVQMLTASNGYLQTTN